MAYKRDTMRLLKPPFTHQHGYIFDDAGQMVADTPDDDDDGGVIRIRGWGRLRNQFGAEKAAQVQDEIAGLVVDALNAFWEQTNHALFVCAYCDNEGPWLDACRREGSAWVCRECGEEDIES